MNLVRSSQALRKRIYFLHQNESNFSYQSLKYACEFLDRLTKETDNVPHAINLINLKESAGIRHVLFEYLFNPCYYSFALSLEGDLLQLIFTKVNNHTKKSSIQEIKTYEVSEIPDNVLNMYR